MKASTRQRWIRTCAWFLAITYGLGAPWTAYLEFENQTLSQRFDLSPALIYLTCVGQTLCVVGVLVRPLALWATAALTVITIGAIVCHFRIGSPQTSVAAFVWTAVQVWFGLLLLVARRDADSVSARP